MTQPAFFQFRLRTAFIVMTLACFVGYEMNWIRQRRQFTRTQTNGTYEYLRDPALRIYPPSALWLFGERGVDSLLVYIPFDETTNDEFRGRVVKETHPRLVKAARLFPEATPSPFTFERTPESVTPVAIEKQPVQPTK